MSKNFIQEKFEECCAGIVFLIDRHIEPEDLRDLEPNAVIKSMVNYIEHARLAVKEYEALQPKVKNCKEWEDITMLFDYWDYDSEENELIFQTDNFRGTIFITDDGEFAINHNIIVLTPVTQFLKSLYPNGEEREFDLNKYYAIEESYNEVLENNNFQNYSR